MSGTADKIIKHKTGLLDLAEELGNVSKARQKGTSAGWAIQTGKDARAAAAWPTSSTTS